MKYNSADVPKWRRRLESLDVEYTEFKEPDLDFKVTALAVFGHEELFKRLKVVTED